MLRPSHPCWFKQPDGPESAISPRAVLVRPSRLQVSFSALYFWTPSAYAETSKSAIPSEKFMYIIRNKTGWDSIQTEEISRDWWRAVFFFNSSKLQPDHSSICLGRLLRDLYTFKLPSTTNCTYLKRRIIRSDVSGAIGMVTGSSHVNYRIYINHGGARGGIVVKALHYKPAGRGFDPRWCHWNFSVT
jgi:hypothetical protein